MMLDFLLLIHLLIAAAQLLVGVLANGLILVVNGTSLIKQRRMDPLALLLACLAISRISVQPAIFFFNLAFLSVVEVHMFPKNFAVIVVVNELGFWLATWLSVFYCTKITTIAHPLFLWLKARISRLVPWLVLGSLLFVSGNAVSHSKYTWIIFERAFLHFSSKNLTTIQIREIPALHLTFLVMELSLPIVIFLVSMLLLIYSLGRHTCQMRNTAMGTREASSRLHLSVLLSMLSFLLLHLSHYMAATLFSSGKFQFGTLVFHLCILVSGVYPSGHSIILILGNPKLRRSIKVFLLCRKRRLRENLDPLQGREVQ